MCVIASDGGALVQAELHGDGAVDSALPQAIAALLPHAPGGVVVVHGPGSYTGVRAGMAAALGFAHARGLPLFTVGTLDVVAAGSDAGERGGWVVADAGRGAVYAQQIGSDAAVMSSPVRITTGELAAKQLPVFCIDPPPGSGWLAVDAAAALARAVPLAIATGPVPRAELRAVHVE